MPTTDAAVRAIITTSLTDLSAFIATAETLVTTHLGNAGLAAPLVDEITRWCAAHYVAVADPRVESGRGLEYQTTYAQGELGMGLQATVYGQQAISLDPTGTLAQLDKAERQRATIEFL